MILIFLFLSSLVIRIGYLATKQYDYWEDSYHHFYTSWESYQAAGYRDFKQNHLFWLPGYHILGVIIFAIFPNPDLTYFQLLNCIIGSLNVVLITHLVQLKYNKIAWSTISGVLLASSATHVVYSTMNMPEIFGGFLLIGFTYALMTDRKWIAWVFFFCCISTRYELWIFCSLLVLLQYGHEFKTSLCNLIPYTSIFLITIILWSIWNFQLTNQPFFWFTAQSNALAWDKHYYGAIKTVSLAKLILKQPVYTIVLSTTIINIVTYGIREYSRKYPFFMKILAVVLIRLILVFLFNLFPVYDPRYLLLDLHLVVLLSPNILLLNLNVIDWIRTKHSEPQNYENNWQLNFSRTRFNQVAIASLMTLLLIIQFQVGQNYRMKEYVIAPQAEAGKFLGKWMNDQNYNDNELILIDSPVVAYYAGLNPDQLRSSEDIEGRNATDLILEYKPVALVFMNVSYTNFSLIFPQISAFPNSFNISSILFSMIFQYNGWELQYGAQPVYIYKLTF